jgi:Flp pilus assembly protein TadG
MNDHYQSHAPPAREQGGELTPAKSGSGGPARRRRLRFGRERGQSIVEFALIAPLFFILIFSIIDFGLGLKAWITVTQATREAARWGAIGAPCDEVEDRAVESSSGLLTTDDVDVTNCQGTAGESVVVSATYDYELVTPLGAFLDLVAGGSAPASIAISSSTDMRLE